MIAFILCIIAGVIIVSVLYAVAYIIVKLLLDRYAEGEDNETCN